MITAVVIGILAVGGAAAAAFLIGKKLQRAKQIAAAEEAQKRMVGVRDSNAADTSKRMRNGSF